MVGLQAPARTHEVRSWDNKTKTFIEIARVPREKALTKRTTAHRYLRFVSDPSELGSEPDSWLDSRYLRVRMKIRTVGEEDKPTSRSRESRRRRH